MSCHETCRRVVVQVPARSQSQQWRIGKAGCRRAGISHLAAAGKAGPLDVARLRESLAHITMHGDELPLFFYSDLFIKHPEVREMFPVSMTAQRGHFVDA